MSESAPPADAGVRREVIEPGRSFIVQAPAGSGKTELLTQRFLRLLAEVDEPQKVLAITFTRKATREMADRVLERLHGAAADVLPAEPHQRLAHGLARSVMERDAQRGWGLLDNPGLLQIHTIDGLCARLAARGGERPTAGSHLSVAEFPGPAYEEAARRTLHDAAHGPSGTPGRAALEGLLLRERGNANSLQTLLANELPRRDQWQSALDDKDRSGLLELRQRLETHVLEVALGRERLVHAGECLLTLAELADPADSEDDFPAAWAARESSPGPASDALAWWHVLDRLASPSAGAPYSPRSINSKVYPGRSGDREAPVRALQDIVEAWRDDEDVLAIYERYWRTPPLDRVRGDESLIEALRCLLLASCEELDGVFAETGVCDFQHIARLALEALGDGHAPGEALLIEDRQLQHILIDEFQDTSQGQYELVERLVSGWEPDSDRSLFLVGDPMQSIYRFRKADVGLFENVFSQGRLGDVPVEPRRLEVNFRSRSTVIQEVNAIGEAVFNPPSPTTTGHVDYTAVTAHLGGGGSVEFLAVPDGEDDSAVREEARLIAQKAASWLKQDEVNNVGVLARQRTHLEPIAAALAEAGVPFEAVEVQSLAQRPVVLDLLTLTRALLHPGDRVAWLGLLLGPWCALQPPELLEVAGNENTADLSPRIQAAPWRDMLEPETLARVERLGTILQTTNALGSVARLAARVEAAWVRLGGPRIARSPEDLEDAESFLRLLARLEEERPEDFLGQLEQRLGRLYAGSRSAPVKLMTIHKAKGLEFDGVFLPALQGSPGSAGRPLFRRHEFRLESGEQGSLMAPIKPAGDGPPGLYDYLGRLAREEEESEAQRLLYVAMTRARHHLHLSAVCPLKKDGGMARKPRSFLELLRPRFEAALARGDTGTVERDVPEAAPCPLWRLPLAEPALEPLEDPSRAADTLVSLGEEPPDRERLALGEALHHWLELIHDHWKDEWLGDWYADHGEALASSLSIAGAPRASLDRLRPELEGLLKRLLAQETVRDMLNPADKQSSRAEAVYLRSEGSRLRQFIVDRLYRDRQGHWHVIDYKTGLDQPETREKWAKQLADYASIVAIAEGEQVQSVLVLQASEGRFIDPRAPSDNG